MAGTVIFGTVEYFEREIAKFAEKNHVSKLSDGQMSLIYSRLKNELLYDFVCDERLRKECLENLNVAYNNQIHLRICVTN